MDERELIQEAAEIAHLRTKRSIIVLGTGLGKSKIAINRINATLGKILYCSSRHAHLNNFQKELEKFGVERDIDICTCHSVLKYAENNYSLIIFDEIHRMDEQVCNFLSIYLLKERLNLEILGLTGTPKRESCIYNYLNISYRKSAIDAIDKNLLNDCMIHIFYYDLSRYEKSKYDYYRSIYDNSRGFGWEKQRMKSFFANSESKLNSAFNVLNKLKDKKTLIFCNDIKQAEKLGIPTYHSKMNKEDKLDNFNAFFNGEIDKLVNINSLKESVSIPNLTNGLCLSIEASTISVEQLLGRFLRLAVKSKSHIIFLVAKDTIEDEWLKKGLINFKQKIKFYNYNDWINL